MIVQEVTRVWARTGGKQTRKYRCTHGHRKGRVMSSPSACNAPINVKTIPLKPVVHLGTINDFVSFFV